MEHNDIKVGERVTALAGVALVFTKGSTITDRSCGTRRFFKDCTVHTDKEGCVVEWDKVLECTVPHYGGV